MISPEQPRDSHIDEESAKACPCDDLDSCFLTPTHILHLSESADKRNIGHSNKGGVWVTNTSISIKVVEFPA